MHDFECKTTPETTELIAKVTLPKPPIKPDEVAAACLYLYSPHTISPEGNTQAL